jgi:hypothetical protein
MNFPPPGPLIVKFEQWTDSLGFCGDIVYKATSSDGSPLPSFIKFNPTLR